MICNKRCIQDSSTDPAFLRAVCQQGIRVLISARTSSVSSELDTEQHRTRQHNSEWLKSLKAGFSRDMELLFHKWFQAAEIDAKTIEHMLAAGTKSPTVERGARDLISARSA